jgi:hypothetical protein
MTGAAKHGCSEHQVNYCAALTADAAAISMPRANSDKAEQDLE